MKMADTPRLIRPVERQPMREWLIDHLDSRDVPGCEWTDRPNGEFHIKWCHGSRHGWSMKDADLFEKWAKHTGRYDENKKDPKKWKANFRCALNSRKDIEEITKKDQLKGSAAYRKYRMKGSIIKEKRRKVTHENNSVLRNIKNENQLHTNDTDVHEDSSILLYKRINASMGEIKFQNQLPKFEQILPEFEKLEYGKMHVLPKQGSGFCVELLKPLAPLKQIPGISLPPKLPAICHDSKVNIAPIPHTYPPTPEASDTSQIADDEDMEFLVEVSDISEEVTVESTDIEYSSSYVITDISQNTSQFQEIKFPSNSQIYANNTLPMNPTYGPITTP